MLPCAAVVLFAYKLLTDMRDMMQWLVAAQEPDSQERRSAQATGRYRHVDGSSSSNRSSNGSSSSCSCVVAVGLHCRVCTGPLCSFSFVNCTVLYCCIVS
jgi:hypothetical protein